MVSKRRPPSSKTTSPTGPSAPTPEEEASFTPPPQASREGERIGDILRRVREHRGEDIESISDYLHIKPAYLMALEDSHYEALPADVYVIGFLRTYALYLGLDGRGAVDQYRREMAGRRRKPQLSMPQPMPEGRAPTIAILSGAAVAVVIIYGLWYWLSTPADPVAIEPVALPQVQEQTTAPSLPVGASAPAKTENTPPLLPQTSTGDGISLTATGSEFPAQPVSSLPQQTATGAATPSTETKTETKESPAPASLEDKKKKEKEEKEEKPAASYGEKKKTRVSLRAEKESWVLITDSRGVTVFDRTLKPGEVYNVPDGKGLHLTTGNIEGLAFSVDGQDYPKMEGGKRVVRALALEPEKLKGRQSAPSGSPSPTNDTEEE